MFDIKKKYDDLLLYSDPQEVDRKAEEIFGTNFYELDLSRQKNKKYRIRFNINGIWTKWINFGQMNYEDYTRHKDKKRRENFLNRNYKWKSLS